MPIRIGLVGDYSESIIAHRAVPLALQLAAAQVPAISLQFSWLHTSSLASLEEYDAVWCVPGSPYANENRVLEAIRWARESRTPFLGTCSGFQHAVVEFARNVLGLSRADHAETARNGECLVISRLECSLVEVEDMVTALPGSLFGALYGSEPVPFGYHCNYGLNPAFERDLEAAGLQIAGRDRSGQARVFELRSHPFFVGTLFQPERAALRGEAVPLVTAFLKAAASSPERLT